jgi:cold-inducible RNA-binding protein
MEIILDYDTALPVTALSWLIIGLLLGMRLPQARRNAAQSVISAATRAKGGPVELYVGNLPAGMGDDALRKLFERYGAVESLRVISNRVEGGGAKVFAFVSMRVPAEAEAAIRALHGKDLDGRRIVVNEARSPRRHRGRR